MNDIFFDPVDCARLYMYMYIVIALGARNYRGDVDMRVINKFLPLVLEAEEESASAPIIVMDNVTFVYIKHNLYSICSLLT